MRLLLDTHILLWAAYRPAQLTSPAVKLISVDANELIFSAASIWEVAIKSGLGRADFDVDPHVLRRELLENGYTELAITSAHAMTVCDRESRRHHADPGCQNCALLAAESQISGGPLGRSDS